MVYPYSRILSENKNHGTVENRPHIMRLSKFNTQVSDIDNAIIGYIRIVVLSKIKNAQFFILEKIVRYV